MTRKATGPECAQENCTSPSLSRGLCNAHYIQTWRVKQACAVDECSSKKHINGLCKRHNAQFGNADFKEPEQGTPEAEAYFTGLWRFVQKELGLNK